MTPKEAYFKGLAEKMEGNYKTMGYEFSAFETKEAAKDFLISNIDKDASIGFGGSMTLNEVGIIEHFRTNNYKNLIDRDAAKDNDEKRDMQISCFSSDVFFTSTNAMTIDGVLINIDKTGNRVAPMIYGPKKVYVIAGINKLEFNKSDGSDRARNKASVMNNIRFGTNNACTKTFQCMECKAESTLCVYTSFIRGSFPKGRLHIIFINENLGF